MNRALKWFHMLAVLTFLLFISSSSWADASKTTISSRDANVNGVKLHYMTAGDGTPLILLHGYAETSLMWKPIIPVLAERFTVIAPDLPGIGDSDIPADGLDMKSAAIRIHDLAKSLGRRRWFKVASAPTSITSGMILPPTRRIRFRKRIAKLMRRPTHGRAECMRDGPISFHS